MTTQTNFHDANRAEVWTLDSSRNASLQVYSKDGNSLSIYLPPHVAEHTAAAFSRAMQAVPTYQRGEYQYTTDRQIWWIKFEPGFGWRAQSDEITGNGDPSWMFADGPDLVTVMDEIDTVEAENGCTECRRIVGADNLAQGESDGDVWRCADCANTEAERQAGMVEMAADDKAHAAMERRAGL